MNADVNTDLAASRPFAVARDLGAGEIEARTVFAKTVVLTGEGEVLMTPNGRWCLLDCVRLLARVVGDLQIVLPQGVPDLETELATLLQTVWSQGEVRQVTLEQCDWNAAAAVLNVGSHVEAALPWTSILANGWIARCTSGEEPLPEGCDQDNPIACMLAASLGATEVFKRIYGVPCDKAPPLKDFALSLFEMATSFSGLGPTLPSTICLPSTLLLGAGAIGNGLTLLASQLPLTGNLLVVDKQDFGVENFGTCTLLDFPSWLGQPKATRIGGWLGTRSELHIETLKSTIQDAISGGVLKKHRIDVVINGLDDVEARRAVQMLWPSLTVDGAINSVGAAVVTHSVVQIRLACLRCAYDLPATDHIAAQSAVTGLSRASLADDQNRLITDDDVAHAAVSARPRLRELQRQGRTICSTMLDAEAAGLGINLERGFSPSVPFVATASAALVFAQLLRNLLWPAEPFIHIFQLPSLFSGLGNMVRVKRFASQACECVRHRAVIERLVSDRQLDQRKQAIA